MSVNETIVSSVERFNYDAIKYDHLKGAKIEFSKDNEVIILSYANVDKRKVDNATNETDKDYYVRKAYTNVLAELRGYTGMEELYKQEKIIVREWSH
ncbi:TPA: hypothetical protein ACN35C_004637 [Vibrio parahaemolyticus]